MTDTLTVTGVLGTEPRSIDTSSGAAMTSFRLASAQRRFDRATQKWIDGSTNWYTVTAFNHLAGNVLGSLSRGDRVIVTGRLSVRTWEAGEKSGTDVAITAESIGADLTWGTTSFTRTVARGGGSGAGESMPSAPAVASGGAPSEPEWAAAAPAGGAAPAEWNAGLGSEGATGADEPSVHSVPTPF